MATVIWAKFTGVGFHRWPAASGRRAYLASRHRHEFEVTAWTPVTHDDRDTEFHDLQALIRAWWGDGERECGDSSCETMCVDLHTWLAVQGVDASMIAVSEDGQAGATYIPEGE